MYAVKPETPEGELIRAARNAKRLTLVEVAAALGISKEKLGYIERGHNDRRKRYVPDDADLSRYAAELGIPAEELERIGRDAAASLLRALPVAEPPPVPADGLEAAFDAVLDDVLKRAGRGPIRASEAETLWFLWHDTDGDSRRRPPAERARSIANWLRTQNAERKPAEKDIRAV